MGVRGLINIQFALASDVLYVLEANPRASRTVPFVSKATGVQMAKAAALIGTGVTINQLRSAYKMLPETGDGSTLPLDAPVSVKEAVLPFSRFRTPEGKVVDSLLGPEMRSTGEVMGIDKHFDTAFAKSQAAANNALPTEGKIFVSVANRDKRSVIMGVKRLSDLGFEIVSTGGTADVLRRNGIQATPVRKVAEGSSAEGEGTIADLIIAGEIDMVFNTPSGGEARSDGYELRAAATSIGIPCITTVAEFNAAVQAIEALRTYEWSVTSLQEHAAHEPRKAPSRMPEACLTAPRTAGRESFGSRLGRAMADRGPLCVGIDPHPALLQRWGLNDDAAGLERFSLTVLEAVASLAAAVKPQVALYERHGSAGIAVLERILAAAAEAVGADHRGRQARRHRLHHGRLRRRLAAGRLRPGRRFGDAEPVPGLRVAAAGPGPRGRDRPRRVRPGADVQPGRRLGPARRRRGLRRPADHRGGRGGEPAAMTVRSVPWASWSARRWAPRSPSWIWTWRRSAGPSWPRAWAPRAPRPRTCGAPSVRPTPRSWARPAGTSSAPDREPQALRDAARRTLDELRAA